MFEKKTETTTSQEQMQVVPSTHAISDKLKQQATTEELITDVHERLERLKLHLLKKPLQDVKPLSATKQSVVQHTYDSYIKAITLGTLLEMHEQALSRTKPAFHMPEDADALTQYISHIAIYTVAQRVLQEAEQDPTIAALIDTSRVEYERKINFFDKTTESMYHDLIERLLKAHIMTFRQKVKDVNLQQNQTNNFFHTQIKKIDVARYDNVLCEAMAKFVNDYINSHQIEIIDNIYALADNFIKTTMVNDTLTLQGDDIVGEQNEGKLQQMTDMIRLEDYAPDAHEQKVLLQIVQQDIRKKIIKQQQKK